VPSKFGTALMPWRRQRSPISFMHLPPVMALVEHDVGGRAAAQIAFHFSSLQRLAQPAPRFRDDCDMELGGEAAPARNRARKQVAASPEGGTMDGQARIRMDRHGHGRAGPAHLADFA